jgi:hypothetical protein
MESAEKRRFFILTPGRSGSTLLAAYLADSGANFGMPVPADWDPSSGDLEMPEMIRAADIFRGAYELQRRRPYSRLARHDWKYRRSRAKRILASALRSADWCKATFNLDYAVFPAMRLGYAPKIIVNYREPVAYLHSSYTLVGKVSVHDHMDAYSSLLENALMLMRTFGGCAIDYQELMGEDEGWANVLEEVCGLSAAALLDSRRRRMTRASRLTASPDFPVPDRARRIYQALRTHKGESIDPVLSGGSA